MSPVNSHVNRAVDPVSPVLESTTSDLFYDTLGTGTYTAVIAAIEDGLATVFFEQDGEEVENAIVVASVPPEDGRHADALLSVSVDSTVVEWNYKPRQPRLGKTLPRTDLTGYRIGRRRMMTPDPASSDGNRSLVVSGWNERDSPQSVYRVLRILPCGRWSPRVSFAPPTVQLPETSPHCIPAGCCPHPVFTSHRSKHTAAGCSLLPKCLDTVLDSIKNR